MSPVTFFVYDPLRLATLCLVIAFAVWAVQELTDGDN